MPALSLFVQYQTTKRAWLGWPRDYKRDGTRPGIVMSPGGGGLAASGSGGAVDPATTATIRRVILALAERWPIVVPDVTGLQFGNATARTDLTFAVALLRQAPTIANGLIGGGASTGAPGAFSASQGFDGAVGYHRAVAPLACHLGVLPGCDLDDVRNFDRGGFRDAINTAHGLAAGSTSDYPTHGSSFAALPAGVNPAVNPPLDLPTYLAYSPIDDICMQATVLAYADATEATLFDVGNTGHNGLAYDALDLAAVVAFFASHLG